MKNSLPVNTAAINAANNLVVYCDGACKGNPGLGGWGFFIKDADTEELLTEQFGGQRRTTNNQMELTAAIEALKCIPERGKVTIHTDSTYVIKGLTEWMKGWIKKGWKASKGGPVKNKELWIELDALYKSRQVTLVWVKGHSGDPGNERADELANIGVVSIQ